MFASSITSKLNSNIFVCGGFDGKKALTMIEVYNIVDDVWETLNFQLPTYLTHCKCFALNNKNILILGNKYPNKHK